MFSRIICMKNSSRSFLFSVCAGLPALGFSACSDYPPCDQNISYEAASVIRKQTEDIRLIISEGVQMQKNEFTQAYIDSLTEKLSTFSSDATTAANQVTEHENENKCAAPFTDDIFIADEKNKIAFNALSNFLKIAQETVTHNVLEPKIAEIEELRRIAKEEKGIDLPPAPVLPELMYTFPLQPK